MDQDVETRLGNLRRAPRCGAMTRTGTACQRPAMRGRKRCRLHGGLSPGAPRGRRNGNYKNGNWTADAIEERRWLRSLVQLFAPCQSSISSPCAQGAAAALTLGLSGHAVSMAKIDSMAKIENFRNSPAAPLREIPPQPNVSTAQEDRTDVKISGCHATCDHWRQCPGPGCHYH